MPLSESIKYGSMKRFLIDIFFYWHIISHKMRKRGKSKSDPLIFQLRSSIIEK